MTKSRKVGIILACALIFALLATNIVPLSVLYDSNTADALSVSAHPEYLNEYTGNYYDGLTTTKIGTSFRSDLAKLITSTHHTNTTYNSGTYALQNVWPQSDKDVSNLNANTIKWFYTGTVTSASNFGGTNGTTNREHVWAKNGGDTFTPESGPGADAHHLRPTECQLNSTRGNLGFGEVSQTQSNIAKQNGSTSYGTFPNGLCFKSGSFFYPAAGYRGATARILMYMQVRYGDSFNLKFVDGATSNNGKSIGKISDLFKWHLQEPPTQEEIYRNNAIAAIQGNRNPFIDHPEYAEMIYCNDGQSYNSTLNNLVAQYGGYLNSNVDPDKIPTALTLSPSSLTLTIGNTSSKINVTATPSTAYNDVNWSSSNTSVATVSSDGAVTAKAEGTATITAISKYDKNVTASLTVTVNPVQLESMTISPNPLTLKEGTGKTLTVTPYPSNAKMNVTWSSSDPSVATVSDGGYVTAVSVGTATITATNASPRVTASITVTVVEAPKPTDIQIIGSPTKKEYIKDEVFDPTGLTVKVMYSDGSSESFSGNDLKENFQWLDGTTGATTLSEGTTTVTCIYGEFSATVTGIVVTNNIDGFLSKMEVIESDDFDDLSLEDQYDAIKQAVVLYNKLTAAEKAQSQVQGKYTTLLAAARDYNEAVSATNDVLYEAATLGSGALIKALKYVSEFMKALINAIFGR